MCGIFFLSSLSNEFPASGLDGCCRDSCCDCVCTILERISSRKEKLAMQIHLKESLLYEFKNSISPPATSVMFLKHWLMVVFVWVK